MQQNVNTQTAPEAVQALAPVVATPEAVQAPAQVVATPEAEQVPAPAVATPVAVQAPAQVAAPTIESIGDNISVTTSFKCSLELRNLLNRRAASTGTNISQLCVELIMRGLTAPEPGAAKVSDIAPVDLSTDTIELLKAEIAQAMKNQSAQAVADIPKPEKVTVTVEKIPDNVIGFNASKEVMALVSRINEGRKAAGFAPLENSLCELLILSSDSLGDSKIFQKITGMNFNDFKKDIIALLESERNTNIDYSYLVPPSTLLGSYNIEKPQS